MTFSNTTFLSIDVETTGLSLVDDRIIQIGFSMFADSACLHTETYDIQQEVPNGAFEVNGITPERIANGHSPYEICVLLWTLFNKKPRRFLFYNSPFDLSFIATEFARFELDWNFSSLTILDPLVIWRRFHPFQKGTLNHVAAHYRIPYNNQHDAGADSAAAGHIYCQMYNQHGELHTTYSNRMLENWYNKWAAQFIAYLQSKRIEYSFEDFQWPCRKELICSVKPDSQERFF